MAGTVGRFRDNHQLLKVSREVDSVGNKCSRFLLCRLSGRLKRGPFFFVGTNRRPVERVRRFSEVRCPLSSRSAGNGFPPSNVFFFAKILDKKVVSIVYWKLFSTHRVLLFVAWLPTRTNRWLVLLAPPTCHFSRSFSTNFWWNFRNVLFIEVPLSSFWWSLTIV